MVVQGKYFKIVFDQQQTLYRKCGRHKNLYNGMWKKILLILEKVLVIIISSVKYIGNITCNSTK